MGGGGGGGPPRQRIECAPEAGPPPETRRPVGVVLREDRHAGAGPRELQGLVRENQAVDVKHVGIQPPRKFVKIETARAGGLVEGLEMKADTIVPDDAPAVACLDDRYAMPAVRDCVGDVGKGRPVAEQLLRIAAQGVEMKADLDDVAQGRMRPLME